MEKYFETLVHFASTGKYRQEVLAAREEHFAAAGQVSEEEDNYEDKLRRFIDWYIFERPLSDTGYPPAVTFFRAFERSFSDEDRAVYDGFCNTRKGLFVVKKSTEEGVTIQDLVSKEKFFVEDDVPKGFFKDEIFQARLIPFQGGYRFGESFCFHPLAVNKRIQKMAKKVDRQDPEAVRSFLEDLIRRRLESERYRHVDVLRFYEDKE